MATHQMALKSAMEIEGALGVALVDSSSGMALGTAGSPMDVDQAAEVDPELLAHVVPSVRRRRWCCAW